MSIEDLYTLMSDGRLIRASELSLFGLHRVSLSMLIEQGKIEKVSRGVYIRSDIAKDSLFLNAVLALRIPQGVFGLDSAFAFHDINRVTNHTWIRLCKGQKKYPKVNDYGAAFVTRSPDFFHQGICTTTIHGVQVRYTSLSHSVAECVVFRNRIGIENMLSAMMLYLKDSRFSKEDFQEACRLHRVQEAVKPYMETCFHLLGK